MTNLLRYMKEKSNYNTKEEAVGFLMNETNPVSYTHLTLPTSDLV